MDLSVEISMYPLNEDFKPSIKAFIARLKADPALHVISNTLSTQFFGPYEAVMAALNREIRTSYEEHGKAIFVAKFLPGDLRPA